MNNGNTNLESFVAKIGAIPLIPKVANKVIKLVENPDTTASQLQEIIDTDQAIASRLLKIANSAFYSYSGSINTTSEAVVLLGFKTIKSLVLAASIKDVYKRFTLTEELIWEHSLFSSISSRFIAREKGLSYQEEAFISGLFHNIGMVIMNNEKPQDFSEVMQRFYNNEVSFIEAENEVFGFTHKEAGALITRKWKLPDFLEKVIRYQDKPEVFSASDPFLYNLASIVYISNLFCLKLKIGLGRRCLMEPDFSQYEVFNEFELSEDSTTQLLTTIKDTYEAEKRSIG